MTQPHSELVKILVKLDFLLYREIKTVLCDLSQQGTEVALKIEHL